MRMPSIKRSTWLLMLLVAALSISSIRCLTEEAEASLSIPPPEDLDEFIFENEEYDGVDFDGGDLPSKQDILPPPPPPPPGLGPVPQVPDYGLPPPPPPPPLQVSVVSVPQPPSYVLNPIVNNYSPPIVAPPPPSYPSIPIVNNYSAPVIPPASYQLNPVVNNYSAPIVSSPPSYQPYPPVNNYSAPAPAPATSYQAPQPVNNYSPPSVTAQNNYQSAPVLNNYSTPIVAPTPVYQSYQQVNNYSAPAPVPAPSYQPAPTSNNYSPPNVAPQSVYQAPQPVINYSPPNVSPQPSYQSYQPVNNYSAPVAAPAPAYQPNQPASNYSPPNVSPQPSYQSYQPVNNYSAPNPAPAPAPAPVPVPIPNYQPYQPNNNYSAPSAPPQPSYQPRPVNNYSPTHVALAPAPASLGSKYSLVDLAPFIPPLGYRSNHWSLFYYRAAPYRTCPKNIYLNGPAYRDIQAAILYAQTQLGQLNNIQYLNASLPTFAARHQIFSFLSQQSARMDEEGLLIEFVSQYLADRACMTKWDKQRYLPQLTKLVSVSHFPGTHSCSNYYRTHQLSSYAAKNCLQSRYRTIDGFCNNPYHPYWGKSNVCHIRLLSPDYADGISAPRNSYNPRFPLPNPRAISNYIHNDIPLEGPYNLMKMQWGQFINHDITNTALSSYDGLVDCCKQPQARGCWPIYVPPGDRFYGPLNVTCLNFIRSGVCPTCQLGPRQQFNKNTAFLDLSHIYGNTEEQAAQLRAYRGGLLRTTLSKNGEILLPIANSQDQCHGTCYLAGDSRVNQHPALTALHTLLLRNHNKHAQALALRHPNWSDEIIFQEARRINIAEFQMITYAEYLPIVFGPILSAYYHLTPEHTGYTYYDPKADPTTWNEYATASCRFGHSQIQSTFGLYSQIYAYGQPRDTRQSYRLKDWFLRPGFLSDGMLGHLINGLLGQSSNAVDPWVSNDVRNHLYQSHKEYSGGDLAATNIWRGRDHGIPGYVHYVEYCFNYKVRSWKDLALFIPPYPLNQLRKMYRVVENIDLFTGGLAERHFPGADTGPTFACINGIQYYHLKFGDRYYFEHGNQAGSFTPPQLDEIRRTTLARLLCRTAYLPAVPQYAFLQASNYNPVVNCSLLGEIDYNKF